MESTEGRIAQGMGLLSFENSMSGRSWLHPADRTFYRAGVSCLVLETSPDIDCHCLGCRASCPQDLLETLGDVEFLSSLICSSQQVDCQAAPRELLRGSRYSCLSFHIYFDTLLIWIILDL